MNERHPYEKSLGEKLNNLPVPDVKKSWQEMQGILDHEMPQGRSKRRGGWWFPVAMIALLIMSTAVILTLNLSPQNGDPPTAGRSADRATSESDKSVNEKPQSADDKILHNKQVTNNKVPGSDANAENKSVSSTDKAIVPVVIQPGNRLPGAGRGQDEKSFPSGAFRPETPGRRGLAGSSGTFTHQSSRTPEQETQTEDAGVRGAVAGDRVEGYDEGQLRATKLPGIQPLYSVTGYTHDSIDLDQPLTVQYSKVDRRFIRANRRHYKPANVRAPYTTTGRIFALGLSLPLGFPLGDQKMLGYNAAAGANTTSDYIPSVHLQYHFHSKSYIQAEFQAMSPQYIRPVMVYHKEYNTSVSHTTSSIYARKLYYLNVPVSVHYSPFRHFYLGTGLQLSSMLSGVAQHEKIRTGMVSSDSVYQSSYAKFGNDSIGSRLRGTELRVLLDANYYWNRFTVGLRYTQALGNYVSMRASPASPPVFDKNKSLQFYLRYNLWEWKKREAPHERILTFK